MVTLLFLLCISAESPTWSGPDGPASLEQAWDDGWFVVCPPPLISAPTPGAPPQTILYGLAHQSHPNPILLSLLSTNERSKPTSCSSDQTTWCLRHITSRSSHKGRSARSVWRGSIPSFITKLHPARRGILKESRWICGHHRPVAGTRRLLY